MSIKLICFDLNRTLVHQNSWLNLNLDLGVTQEEDQYLLDLYEAGKISYKAWTDRLLELYRERGRATRHTISRSLSNYTYMHGARETVAYLRQKGYIIVLLTGAIDILASQVAKDLGIELFRANHTFNFDEKGWLTSIETSGQDDEVKVEQLASICKGLGIVLQECACIGDGDNDRKLFEATGHGITFAGSKIASSAEHIISSLTDLRQLF